MSITNTPLSPVSPSIRGQAREIRRALVVVERDIAWYRGSLRQIARQPCQDVPGDLTSAYLRGLDRALKQQATLHWLAHEWMLSL